MLQRTTNTLQRTTNTPQRTIIPAALLALAFAGIAPAHAEPKYGPWEATRNDDGIRVIRRTVEGSPLHEFQGRAIVDAPLDRIVAVIQDSSHRTEWMHQCAGSYTVEEPSSRSQISYNRTAAPWPVSDRDAALRGDTAIDLQDHSLRITFVTVQHPKVPPVSGVVRMPHLIGHWYLWPRDHGRTTEVEYQVHADPGGSLPNWVINFVSKQIPWKTISGLRAQVKRRSYPEFEARLRGEPDYQALMAGIP